MLLHGTSLSVQISIRLSGQKLVLLRKRASCELVRIKTCPASCKRKFPNFFLFGFTRRVEFSENEAEQIWQSLCFVLKRVSGAKIDVL